jgi:threonine dehydratase
MTQPATPLRPVTLAEIEAARARIAGAVLRTPLLALEAGEASASTDARRIHLKPECLQPTGSFKVRGAENALAALAPEERRAGVWTPSAGNMALGVARASRRLGIAARALVPDSAPRAKLEALARLGCEAVPVPRPDWWRALVEHRFPGMLGPCVHPVASAEVIAANGTIGLEILEDLPEVDTVLVPYGGGGLATGIACALRARGSRARVVATEVSSAAPLGAALRQGRPVPIEARASFVDGIGASSVLDEMWPLVSSSLSGAIAVSPAEIAEAIRLLATRQHLVAEGAGASSVAAALHEGVELGREVVCVVSGGNLDAAKLERILSGGVPE